MDGVRSLGGIFGAIPVGERNGGRNGHGDAFRQALEQQQQQGGEAAAGDSASGAESPMRSALQSRAAADRKKESDGRHVDVFA
jgi:hypothetical protein